MLCAWCMGGSARASCRLPDATCAGRSTQHSALSTQHRCDGIFVSIFMPTTVHIPPALLDAVDRRAKALGISRNRLIVRSLERALTEGTAWTPEFLEGLRAVDSETAQAVDELLAAVKHSRRSKAPREL